MFSHYTRGIGYVLFGRRGIAHIHASRKEMRFLEGLAAVERDVGSSAGFEQFEEHEMGMGIFLRRRICENFDGGHVSDV